MITPPQPTLKTQQLPAHAPVVAVPMCVKHIDGQNYHTVGEKYLTALIDGSGVYPLSFPALGTVLPVEALLDHVDGLLLTGSPSNIAVGHYGGDPDRDDSPQDPGRDAVTLPLIRAALQRDIPLLAICRGFQELNVALGGTLHTRIHKQTGKMDHRGSDGPYDDIYKPAHDLILEADSRFAAIFGATRITINSVHWQAIDRPADRLVVEGRAPDGVIEAVRVKGATFALGVQWHPEYRCIENADSMKLFGAFGDAVRVYATARRSARDAGRAA
ncbi:gamma-glutamyl-gamma-aminobutyrate hydrolase [Dongia mobilis]|uniref:gamma-glutamyl-gamma-aminobutyrate hydrolase n=1 Tax=Dongia mobilis TaxID=578943 RepID=A0A4R6WM29_9PROT|nr:gamma-glutamyl-gamma-aminobutyrate hydrolase family protein [Dongia mobilis]TDQ82039.1 gamma-glutamyl-gamma-aminobutyrate hydrolase [Dongia mobilis]